MSSKKESKGKKSTIKQYFHYQEINEKKYGQKTIVLEQCGDFFEVYCDPDGDMTRFDEVGSLLNWNRSMKSNFWMMGCPLPSLWKHVNILTNNGYTVSVIEQVTPAPDPVRKETGVYSPSTNTENMETPDSNNLLCIYVVDDIQKNGTHLTSIGLSIIDFSTGESIIHEAYGKPGDEKYALDNALRFIYSSDPKEIIFIRTTGEEPGLMTTEEMLSYLEIEYKNLHVVTKLNKHLVKISYQNTFFGKIWGEDDMATPIEYLGLDQKPYARLSFIYLLDFAYQHNQTIIHHISKPTIFNKSNHLVFGNNAINQLSVFVTELSQNLNTKFKSLFDVVNNTTTAIGKRFLHTRIGCPLVSEEELNKSYKCIEELLENDLYKQVEEILRSICDTERLQRRIAMRRLHPYELHKLIMSYQSTIKLFNLLKGKKEIAKLLPNKNEIKKVQQFLKHCNDTFNMDVIKANNINDMTQPYFKKGVSEEIDELQTQVGDNITFMENICEVLDKYIVDSGKAKLNPIKGTRIKLEHNSKDGYFLKLTKLRGQSLKKNIGTKPIKVTEDYSLDPKTLVFKESDMGKDKDPDNKKGQTKIFFEDLNNKSQNTSILKEELTALINEKYMEELEEFDDEYNDVFKLVSRTIGMIDFIKSNAKTARLYNYVKPTIKVVDNGYLKCENLRHPIIERINTKCEYVPHTIQLGQSDTNLLDGILLYGTNSSGKSSLMKAIGLGVIMAQSGMFVPATSFEISPYHSIFARITGNDNMFKKLSSFALEMTELNAIIQRNGPTTLVIGDEICRGTEHVSGNSLVAASIVKLAKSGSSFIFASHLHEIVELDRIKELKNVKAFHLTIEHDKKNDMLVFDRQLKEGAGEQIYGILVAQYIIKDKEFIKLAQDIKCELLETTNTILENKTSQYNSKVYMYKCEVCGKDMKIKKYAGDLDTHHINHQKDCKDGFVINKPHLPKDSEANLIPLCKECHYKVHHNKLEIIGYKDTTKGRKLQYEHIDTSSEDAVDDNSSEEYIAVQPKKKYNDDQVNSVRALKGKKIGEAVKILRLDKGMKITAKTVKKIWSGNY